MSDDLFLVTGGTGRIGTAFVHEIAARGMKVRLGTRDPQGKDALLRKRFAAELVEPVVVEHGDAAGLERAFKGVTGALFVAPFGEMKAWHEAMAAAARKASVRHVVKVSVTGARSADSVPPPGRIPSMHYEGEQALVAAGLSTTMIRPTIFAQHFLGLSDALFRKGDGRFYLPTGDAKIAFLDCRDIAACAAAILVDEDKRAAWSGKAFELTGPSAVTARDIAEILSLAGGRAIEHVDGVDAFVAHAKEIGAQDTVKGIYGEAAGGWFGDVHDDEFRAIVGRRTTSFAKFAFDHAAFYS